MNPTKPTLTRADLVLLHGALAYMRKRSFQPVEAVRLQGLLDRLEELLLDSSEQAGQLRLSPPEQEVLSKEILRYCEALTQRGASSAGLEEAARLQEIRAILVPGRGRPGRWKGRQGR
jgi:hypothetical protein